jgi:hypothetical protein
MNYDSANCPDNQASDDCWWSLSFPQGDCPPNAQGGCCLKDGWTWTPPGLGGSCVQVCVGMDGACSVDGDCCAQTAVAPIEPMHCSTVDQTGNPVSGGPHCCPDGMYWSNIYGVCVDAAEYYHPSDPNYCPFYPPNDPINPQSGWWGVFPWCVDIPNDKVCCYLPEYMGETDVYHMLENSITPY